MTNLWNYELKAPGTGINSTVPNGGYRLLTGTSMATPLVAGAMALYHKEKPSDSKELIFGNLINTSSSYVDFKAAIEITPTPLLKFISAENKDDSDSQNGNGFWEPGETIEIFPLIKNYWGPTTDVRVGIEFAEFEDTSKATIVESEIAIGSISAYANLKHVTKSLKIKIADNVANDVDIKFKISVWSGPDKEYLSSDEYIINVKNSILLFGNYTSDLTLYPEKEYLVSANFVMDNNTTLTIMPGTILKISNGVQIWIKGDLNAIGTFDNRIKFIAEDIGWKGFLLKPSKGEGTLTPSSSYYNFKFCEFLYTAIVMLDVGCVNCNYTTKSYVTVEDSIFYDIQQVFSSGFSLSGYNSVTNTNINFVGQQISSQSVNTYNNITHNVEVIIAGATTQASSISSKKNNIFNNGSGFNTNQNISGTASGLQGNDSYFGANYYGSSKKSIIDKNIIDYIDNSNLSLAFYDNYLNQPHEEAHGIVWKVLVNGKDAQDEYDRNGSYWSG